MRTLTCPEAPEYTLEIDPVEYDPEDPGQGTPLLVVGPRNASGTYDRVIDTAELYDGDTCVLVPSRVIRWLQSDGVVRTIKAELY